ncbi:MAG: DUF3179 domain-containing (seleno)protein [Phycisphaerales bacterium]|nr:DUF3179 domain-containing (seleno)protein [Phycisphaerales bacterium]
MSDSLPNSGTLRPTPKGPIRFKEGGWLLLLTLLFAIGLLAWGLAPALFQMADRPPGNGKDIESYAFDLSSPRIPLEMIEPATLHRDMIPIEVEPIILSPEDIKASNEGRRRYLIPNDLVIGIVIDGHARAYPLSILNVHEVINDRINDVPIAVTWHWPSGATRVLNRHVNDNELILGTSGLVAGGNQLLYPIRNDNITGNEPLVSQVLGQSITGSQLVLEPIPHEVVPWSDWITRHPQTTAAGPRPELKARYKKGKPDTWFKSSDLMFNTPVPQDGPPPKSHMLLIRGHGDTTIIAIDELVRSAAGSNTAFLEHAGRPVKVAVTMDPPTARLEEDDDGLEAMRILWISGHAMAPEAGLPIKGTHSP